MRDVGGNAGGVRAERNVWWFNHCLNVSNSQFTFFASHRITLGIVQQEEPHYAFPEVASIDTFLAMQKYFGAKDKVEKESLERNSITTRWP